MKKVLYILIAAISIMAFSGCGMKNTVQIGTGDVNGTYYAYGTELAEILNNNSDVYFKVRKTAGSAANLRLISQEYVDVAFVQRIQRLFGYCRVIYRGDTSCSAERFGYKFNKRFIRKKCIAWRKRIGCITKFKTNIIGIRFKRKYG